MNGKVALPTKEGKAAIEDALSFLSDGVATTSLCAPSQCGLKLAAEDHLVDRGHLGIVGHEVRADEGIA